MKKLNNSIIKTYVLAFFNKCYGFAPKSGDVAILSVNDDMSVIRVIVNEHIYEVCCGTSYIEGIGFNGFDLNTLEIYQVKDCEVEPE